MSNKQNLATHQLTLLVLLFTLGSSILIVPSLLGNVAKRDAWLITPFILIIIFLITKLYASLGRRFPESTFVEYSEQILGKWIGKLVSILYIGFAIVLSSLVIHDFGSFITTDLMPETPMQAIHLLLLIIVIYAVRLGLETFARATEVFFPFVLVFFLILTFSILPKADFHKLLPILEKGINPVLHGSFSLTGLPVLETCLFLMLLPNTNQSEKVQKAMFLGLSLGIIMLLVPTTLCIVVLGPHMTAYSIYPTFLLAKKISIANFIERIESLLALLWITTIFTKLTICFYVSALGLSQILNLKSYRPIILPLAMILFPFSIEIFPNITDINLFAAETWPFYTLTIGLVLPLILWIGSFFRRKGQKQNT